MSKVLAKVKDYAITEEMLNETVEALRTQQNINITSEEQPLYGEIINEKYETDEHFRSEFEKTFQLLIETSV